MQEFQESSAPVIEKPVNGILPGFNTSLKYVSNKGDHAFVSLNFNAGDVREPCPGLNAVVNHRYITNDGVRNHTHFPQGTIEGIHTH